MLIYIKVSNRKVRGIVMAFHLGDIAERLDSGSLRGIQREVACECWFTSRGKTIPRRIRIMDEDGVQHLISEIRLLATEEKTYAGIRTVEHLCRIGLGGRQTLVKLVFTKESCRWTLVAV